MLDQGRFVLAGQEKRLRDAYRDAARAQALIDSGPKPKRNRRAGPRRISEHDVLRSANAGVFAGIAAAPEGVGGLAARVYPKLCKLYTVHHFERPSSHQKAC